MPLLIACGSRPGSTTIEQERVLGSGQVQADTAALSEIRPWETSRSGRRSLAPPKSSAYR
jgi:hypothetical protein